MTTPTDTPPDQPPAGQLVLFEDQQIRRVMHNGEWHWSIVDIIKALTGSANPRRYWSDLKRQLAEKEGFFQLYEKIVQLKLRSPDGKERETDVANMETLFRLIQSVPSPKAEPLKQWLAKTAVERIHEEADPALAIERAISTFRRRGRTSEWIKARIDGILKRKELCEEWDKRGARKQIGILTNRVYVGTFGLDAKGLRRVKGLRDGGNPRDAMDTVELSLVNLSETVAAELTRQRDAQGFAQCAAAADAAGEMAGNTRRNIEALLGRPVVTTANAGRQPAMLFRSANLSRKPKAS